MKPLLFLTLASILSAFALAACTGTAAGPVAPPGPPKTMKAFTSEKELTRYLQKLTQAEKAVDDKCRASCIDWYGNARPLFLRGRVFALLGYELVEGKLENGNLAELRRINYAP